MHVCGDKSPNVADSLPRLCCVAGHSSGSPFCNPTRRRTAMRTAHVITTAVLVATFSVAGCNRPDTRENARAAAAEVKDAAGRASEKLADSWLATKIQAQYFA